MLVHQLLFALQPYWENLREEFQRDVNSLVS